MCRICVLFVNSVAIPMLCPQTQKVQVNIDGLERTMYMMWHQRQESTSLCTMQYPQDLAVITRTKKNYILNHTSMRIPAGHCEHLEVPEFSANVPPSHGIQTTEPFVEKYPTGQRLIHGEPRPMALLNEPAAHGVGETLPCGQKVLEHKTRNSREIDMRFIRHGRCIIIIPLWTNSCASATAQSSMIAIQTSRTLSTCGHIAACREGACGTCNTSR